MSDMSGGSAVVTPDYLFIQHPRGKDGVQFAWFVAEYTIDATRSPKWIDLTSSGKSSNGHDVDWGGFGVYELADDTLRISYRMGAPRVFRTLEFKAGIEEPMTGGDGKPEPVKPACALLELKRVKTP